jgi:hypothetical protein
MQRQNLAQAASNTRDPFAQGSPTNESSRALLDGARAQVLTHTWSGQLTNLSATMHGDVMKNEMEPMLRAMTSTPEHWPEGALDPSILPGTHHVPGCPLNGVPDHIHSHLCTTRSPDDPPSPYSQVRL